MKFNHAWTLAGKPRDGTPAPPPRRTPVLPRPPAFRAQFRQIGKWIFRAMLAVFRTGRRQHLAFGEFHTSPPRQYGTTAGCHTRLLRTKHVLEIYGLDSAYRTVRAGLLAGSRIGPPRPNRLVPACWEASEIGSDFLNGGLRLIAT